MKEPKITDELPVLKGMNKTYVDTRHYEAKEKYCEWQAEKIKELKGAIKYLITEGISNDRFDKIIKQALKK